MTKNRVAPDGSHSCMGYLSCILILHDFCCLVYYCLVGIVGSQISEFVDIVLKLTRIMLYGSSPELCCLSMIGRNGMGGLGHNCHCEYCVDY